MMELNKSYNEELDVIRKAIQNSEQLSTYLESEEEESYNELKNEFEPAIEALHDNVSMNDPLQLIALENKLLDPAFEGLFLPRILGYSVLRGSIDDTFKYIRPQNHFRKVILAIAESANFEHISKRIGQTIEVGFALSSDIWITNLISEIDNKRVKAFLQEQRKAEFRDVRSRHTAYLKYQKQLSKYNFLTVETPDDAADLKLEFNTIRTFLLHRAGLSGFPISSVYSFLSQLIKNDSLGNSQEHLEILMIIGLFFELEKEDATLLAKRLEVYNTEIDDLYLRALVNIQNVQQVIDEASYKRLHHVIESRKIPSLQGALNIISQTADLGYLNAEAAELIKDYCNGNQGLSLNNTAIRNYIYAKLSVYINSLQESDYNEYFEINKAFAGYMNLFDNERFNQGLKDLSMRYVKKLLKVFVDKRGKEYQDVKRFISTVFVDQRFLKDKEVKEMFKTKRKKV